MEAAVEDVARESVATVEPLSVRPVEPLHALGEVPERREDEQMDVVRDQAVRRDEPAETDRGAAEQLHVVREIDVVEEDRQLADAARRHVMGAVRRDDPQRTRHAGHRTDAAPAPHRPAESCRAFVAVSARTSKPWSDPDRDAGVRPRRSRRGQASVRRRAPGTAPGELHAVPPQRRAGGPGEGREAKSQLDSESPDGSDGLPNRFRRSRHGRRPRHRQHARLRARARHRALRAERRRDRPAHRRGARRRRRGQAHARAHARHDQRDPAAEGRRHRRLRRHRADAPPLHPEGAPAPLRAPARRRLRPVGRHRRREARRRGGHALAREHGRRT